MKTKFNKYSDVDILELAEIQLKKERRKAYTIREIFLYADKIKTYLRKKPSKVGC